jgi:hypothetical protein
MLGYTEIETQSELDSLLDRAAGFHDSMIKELHLVNRAYVSSDHSMFMNHRFDAQLLVQTQWTPFAVEIIFIGIEEMRTDSASDFWVQLAASSILARRQKSGVFRLRLIGALRSSQSECWFGTEAIG